MTEACKMAGLVVAAGSRFGSIQGRDWAMLVACAAVPMLTVGLFTVSFPLWVEPWRAGFKVSLSTVMLTFTVGNMVATFAAPLAGRALARRPPRMIVVGGALLMTAGFLVAALAPAFWMVASLYATVIAVGAAFSGLLPAQTVALRRFPDRAGAIGGMLALALSLGSALSPLAIAPALAVFGWRPVFAAAGAVLSAVAIPLAWFCLPKGAGPVRPSTTLDVALLDPGLQSNTTKVLLGTPAFWLVLAITLPLITVAIAIPPNIVAIASDAEIGLTKAGYLVSAMAVGSAIGGVILGSLADRIEPKLTFVLVSTLMFGALGMVALSPNHLMTPGLVLFGLASGGIMPLFGVIVLRRFGQRDFPTVQGLITPFFIPAFLGSAVAAWIRDLTGSYALALVVLAFALLPGMIMIWGLGALKLGGNIAVAPESWSHAAESHSSRNTHD
jgi:MFS family permease